MSKGRSSQNYSSTSGHRAGGYNSGYWIAGGVNKTAALLFLVLTCTACSMQGVSKYKLDLASALEKNSAARLAGLVCPSSGLTSQEISSLLVETYALYNIASLGNFSARRGDNKFFVYRVDVTSRSGRASTQFLYAPNADDRFCPTGSPVFELR